MQRAPGFKKPSWLQLFWFDATVLAPKHWIGLGVSLCFLFVSLLGLALRMRAGLTGFFATAGLFGLAWSGWRIFKDLFRFERIEITESADVQEYVSRVKPDARTEACGGNLVPFQSRRGADAVVRSALVDHHLRENAKQIRVVHNGERRARLHEQVRRDGALARRLLRAQFRAARRDGRMFHNEEKICLLTDILVGTETVEVGGGSYYLSYLTNELCRLDFEVGSRTGNPRRISEALPTFRRDVIHQDTVRMYDISSSRLANHIGGNTVALSSDGKLCLWQQGVTAMYSERLLAPTGSGSLDWADLSGQEWLEGMVVRGMEREYLQESSRARKVLHPEDVRATRLLGYFRWVGRGGLPGFVGITRLNVPRQRLEPNPSEVRLPEDLETVYDAGTPVQLQESVQRLLERQALLSVPLFVNLLALLEVLESAPEYLADFFD